MTSMIAITDESYAEWDLAVFDWHTYLVLIIWSIPPSDHV